MPRQALRLLIAATLLILTLAVSACDDTAVPDTLGPAESTAPNAGTVETTAPGTSTQTAPTGPSERPSTSSVTEGPSRPSSTPALDAQAAVDVALAAVPGGVVIEVERDNHWGRPTWEVLVRDSNGEGIELYMDMAGGEILKREQKRLSQYERDAVLAVDISTAMTTALRANPGEVKEAELKRWSDGRLVWEVEIIGVGGRSVELSIDVATGEIVR